MLPQQTTLQELPAKEKIGELAGLVAVKNRRLR